MPGTIKQLTHGSLFAGIGGFDEGFRRSGFRVTWQVEKEPFCRAVLKTKFPESELLEDVRDCGKSNLRAVDVLTAGFPCQDLSVAGKRAGLAGSRSGLFWEVVRILGELRPAWFVLENVPGLFSSNNGDDFRIVLQSLDELRYGLAWRVLDSQFFGVAQRRRRVFIVGRFGKPCAETILFESESGEGNFTESGETWSGVAAPLTSGIGITGNAPGRRREDDINLVAGFNLHPSAESRSIGYAENICPTLRGGNGGNRAAALSFAENQRGELRTSHITPQLSCSGGKPGSGYPAIAFSNRGVAGEQFETIRSDCNGALPMVAAALSRSTGHHGHSSPRGDGSDNIIVQQAISSKWAKGTSGPAGDEHHNLIAGTLKVSNPGGCRIDAEGAADGFLQCAPTDPNGVRTFAGLPEGLDSARYRALGNAVTATVAEWIGRRIVAACEADK